MRGRGFVSIYFVSVVAVACGQTGSPSAGDKPPVAETTTALTQAPQPPRGSAEPKEVERTPAPVTPSPVSVAPSAAPEKRAKPEPDVEFVVPRKVTLALGRVTVDRERTALLDFLVAGASNGCRHVGPLVHSSAYSRDRLVVRIEGYERSGEPPKDAVCTADIQHATARVEVEREWLVEGDRTLVVVVGRAENRLELDFADHYATLTPSWGSSIRTHGREVGLFPMDVGELYVAGNVGARTDYRDELRELAYEQGWEPADEAYEGIRQPHRHLLYVVVRDRRFPPEDRSERVGKVSRGVHAYLSAINDTPSTM